MLNAVMNFRSINEEFSARGFKFEIEINAPFDSLASAFEIARIESDFN